MDWHNLNLTQFLESFIKDKKELDAELKERMALQLLDGINTLHNKDIFHKNIKSENILVSNNQSLKETPLVLRLSDLGIAFYY